MRATGIEQYHDKPFSYEICLIQRVESNQVRDVNKACYFVRLEKNSWHLLLLDYQSEAALNKVDV